MDNENSRRDFIKKSAALALGTIAATAVVNKTLAATEFIEKEIFADGAVKFNLPKLPYEYDALEPHIDKLTMEIHHGKHHQAYVTNLNKALETIDPNVLKNISSLEDIFGIMDKMPVAVRNNAGGHSNHSLFWTLMKPHGGGIPPDKLAEAINATYGSFEEFKKQFADAAMKRFGSGWAWLVVNKGKLSIGSTANQDHPMMHLDALEIKGTPVLALDVWEHAYYLKNQNRRADYINSFWNVVNWETANNLFTSAK